MRLWIQDGPPSKRQKTNTPKAKVEREQTKTKVAPAKTPVQERKKTPEPLGITSTRQSARASRSNSKGLVLYSKNTGTGQDLITPGRELRSGTRSNPSTTQTKVPVNSKTPASKKATVNTPTSKDIMNGSSPLTRSKRNEAAVTPEPSWDVRRLPTSLQKESSESPLNTVRGNTPLTRSVKKELVGASQDSVRGKTPSRRSQPKSKIEVSRNSVSEKALAIIVQPKEEPQTRARTRAQILAVKKVCISDL